MRGRFLQADSTIHYFIPKGVKYGDLPLIVIPFGIEFTPGVEYEFEYTIVPGMVYDVHMGVGEEWHQVAVPTRLMPVSRENDLACVVFQQ